MKNLTICCPDSYYSEAMQKYMTARRNDNDKKWIYQLIDGTHLTKKECVYINCEDWLLCKDIHPGDDVRFVVIFKDLSLKTIRDLNSSHVPMLQDIQKQVQTFLYEQVPNEAHDYKFFFHYFPTVFQLHAHVSRPHSYNNQQRTHMFNAVIANLKKSPTWYRNSLILTSLPKQMRCLEEYSVFDFK